MGQNLHAELIERLAANIAERLARKLIRRLQGVSPGLLADEGATNLWDEICVQFRRDSPLIELYADELTRHMSALISELSDIERLTLWFQTYSGAGFLGDAQEHRFCDAVKAVSVEATTEWVVNEHVRYECMNYENNMIRDLTGE